MSENLKRCPCCEQMLFRDTDFYRRADGRGGYRTDVYCKSCKAEKAKQIRREKGALYIAQLERRREYWGTRREIELPISRRRAKDEAEQLTRHYIAMALRMRVGDVPPDLERMKREQLGARRMARTLRKALTDESVKDGS